MINVVVRTKYHKKDKSEANQHDVGQENPGDVEAQQQRWGLRQQAVLQHVAQAVSHRHLTASTIPDTQQTLHPLLMTVAKGLQKPKDEFLLRTAMHQRVSVSGRLAASQPLSRRPEGFGQRRGCSVQSCCNSADYKSAVFELCSLDARAQTQNGLKSEAVKSAQASDNGGAPPPNTHTQGV